MEHPEKGVVPSPTTRYSNYWKGSLLVALNYGRPTYLYIWRKKERKREGDYFKGSITYWPSTEPSIMRCTCVNNWCIRSKISEYHLDLWTGWIRCRCDAYRKQMGIKQLYNQVPQTVWVSLSLSLSCSSVWVAVACGVRTSSRQRASALRNLVEQPSRMRKKYCYSQRNLGSICGSLFRLQLTSHT